MEVTVLGAGSVETSKSWTACLLIDGVLALDAGSLSSGLSLEEQKQVKAVLITHCHFDHVKDLPMIGLATAFVTTKEVCGQERTLEFVRSHLFDGDIYPRLEQWPSPEKPSLRLRPLEPLVQVEVAGFRVKPVPLKHGAVSAVGYEVASTDEKTLFYTGDTGGDLSSCWEHAAPDLLITEVSMPDRMEEWARASGHLTPTLLEKELTEFKRLKGFLPRVLVMHMNVAFEAETRTALSKVAKRLGAAITPGRRYLKVRV